MILGVAQKWGMLQIVISSGTDDKALVSIIRQKSYVCFLKSQFLSVPFVLDAYTKRIEMVILVASRRQPPAPGIVFSGKTCEPSQKDQIGLYSFVFETL